ncbi:MAG TPA: response regulator [Actinomycetota bacterium]|nr:response regulator [Actinomycetota bacterium]
MAGDRARILVADDDPVILRLLEVNLGLEGFDVETAARGEEALAKARRSRPALILLDVMMPGLNGWDVARELKADPTTADVPVVLLSARTQEEDRRRGQELGADAYITKPFDPSELAETIRRLARPRL